MNKPSRDCADEDMRRLDGVYRAEAGGLVEHVRDEGWLGIWRGRGLRSFW